MSPEGGGAFFWGGEGAGPHGFQEKEGGQPLLTGTNGGPGKKKKKIIDGINLLPFDDLVQWLCLCIKRDAKKCLRSIV